MDNLQHSNNAPHQIIGLFEGLFDHREPPPAPAPTRPSEGVPPIHPSFLTENGKRRVPNRHETAFIEALRNILAGRIRSAYVLSELVEPHYLEIASTLFKWYEKWGVRGFWQGYHALARKDERLAEWEIYVKVPPAPFDALAGRKVIEFAPERVHWLWQGRLALGKLTILEGDPGKGKSMLALDLAARISSGQAMPGGSPGVEGGAGVVLITVEDDVADTVRPRLERAGGDLTRLLYLGKREMTDRDSGQTYERVFNLAEDLDWLEKGIERVKARLVIIDPLMAIIGGTDIYKETEVRQRLGQLEEIMRRHRCCGLIIRHLAKNRNPVTLMQGSGSIGFIAHVRLGLRVFDDPIDPNRRVLAQIKTNVGREAAPLLFQVDATLEDDRPYVEWLGPVDYTLGELAGPTPSQGRGNNSARQEILELLQECSPEAMSAKDLAEELPDFDESTIRGALKRLADEDAIVRVERGRYVVQTEKPSPTT